MRRMRQTLKKTYYLRKATDAKDGEGSTYKTYGEAKEIQAIIRYNTMNFYAVSYGERIDAVLKMQYEGDEDITVGDGICVHVSGTEEPDFIVKSIKGLTDDTFKVYTLEAV